MQYWFAVEPGTGRIVVGMPIDDGVAPPEGVDIEGDAQVWAAPGRSFFDTAAGRWVIHAPIIAAASQNPALSNAVLTVTATLPPTSPDASVTFQVEGGSPYVEPAANGEASHAYVFASPGVYRISASSSHHGIVLIEVVVQ